jgi:hypothetical protein
MTMNEAIAKLDALTGADNEADHGAADQILVDFLKDNGGENVALAYERCQARFSFWYA